MAEENGIASGFVGMFNAFVDPAGLAKRVPAKLFWVGPVVTVTIIFLVYGYLMAPFTMQLIDTQMSQRNIPADQLERARSMAHTIGGVTMYAIPVFALLFLLLIALLVNVMGSMVGLRTKFRDIFSIMAACSLIQALQLIALDDPNRRIRLQRGEGIYLHSRGVSRGNAPPAERYRPGARTRTARCEYPGARSEL